MADSEDKISTVELSNFAVSNNESITEKIAGKRENSRTWISLSIVFSLLFIVVGSFVSLWCIKGYNGQDLRIVLELLISPVIGIVGAVTGFYFGEKENK